MLFNIKILIKVLTINVLLLFISNNLQGQNTNIKEIGYNQGSPYIRWVKQFPIPKSKKRKPGIFKRIGKFFFW